MKLYDIGYYLGGRAGYPLVVMSMHCRVSQKQQSSFLRSLFPACSTSASIATSYRFYPMPQFHVIPNYPLQYRPAPVCVCVKLPSPIPTCPPVMLNLFQHLSTSNQHLISI